MEEKEYVTRLAHMKCSCGTKVNYLNAPEDHGVAFSDGERCFMNANDHEPGTGKNIVHFGRCKSVFNPGNVIAMASFTALAMVPGLIFLGASLLTGEANDLLVGICKCNPKTFEPWEFCSDDHFIEGAPALTKESKLSCFYGGIIEFTTDEVG